MLYFLILLTFALLPSFAWLLYYLKKDDHPEPKKMILYVFLTGAFFAIIGLLFQKTAVSLFESFKVAFPSLLFFFSFFYTFVIIAFSEELLKYIAFFFAAKDHRELDEPVDCIIYIITAALGFAALENFLLLISLEPDFYQMMRISMLRFLSATILHATASGIVGVFLVYSIYFNKKYLLPLGLVIATFFHGIYNIFAAKIDDPIYLVLLFSLLSIMSLTLLFFIKNIKKLKPICLIK